MVGSGFYADIVWMQESGITLGCGNDAYCASDSVTRAQMATFLVRALELAPDATNYFSDDNGNIHEANINALRSAGVTLGCNAEGTLFCPSDTVTRAQMASFLVRALGYPISGTDHFTDDNGNTHEDNINTLRENEVTLGCNAGGTLYCPNDSVRRDHMAAFIHRAGPSDSDGGLLTLLESLAVEAEQPNGYDRGLFRHWVDADGDGCDTRREVLITEAVTAPAVGGRCALSDGVWVSRYDGETDTGNGRGFDIDHLVPLKEAWDSGAHGWDPQTREQFANDLGYEHSLVAVSAGSNRSKGAQDPTTWLPPESSQRCWYAAA